MPKPMKPCIMCNGPKERGHQGSRLCYSCRHSEEWKRFVLERETSRLRRKQYQDKYRRSKGQPPRPIKIRDDGQVWCSKCRDYLDASHFSKRKSKQTSSGGDHFNAYCHSCQRDYSRNHRLQLLYGVDLDTYSMLLQVQGNVCFICRKSAAGRSLAVDHDHSTGEVRGLLCHQCNSGVLGALADSVDALKRAIEYLENPPARWVGLKRGITNAA